MGEIRSQGLRTVRCPISLFDQYVHHLFYHFITFLLLCPEPLFALKVILQEIGKLKGLWDSPFLLSYSLEE
jgi:hypothetical protein